MMSSSEDEFSGSDGEEEAVYSSGDENDNRRKRLTIMHGYRKKTRSLGAEDDGHTGLSPRMTRMDIISNLRPRTSSRDVFFLDDGVETFSVDYEDPRVAAVRELYNELEQRLQVAATLAGLSPGDPAVSALRNQLAVRAAELEDYIAKTLCGPAAREYREAIMNIIRWIQNASEHDLRIVLETGLLALPTFGQIRLADSPRSTASIVDFPDSTPLMLNVTRNSNVDSDAMDMVTNSARDLAIIPIGSTRMVG